MLQEEDSKNDTSSVEVTSSPTPALNTIDTTQTYQSYDTFPSQSVLGFVFVVVIIAIVYYCRRKLTKQPASASYSRVPVNEETARRDDPEDDFEDWPDDDIELSKVQRNGGSSIPHVTNLTLSPKASSAPPRALSPVGTIAPPVIKPISTSSSGELRSRSTSRNSASNAKTLRPTSLDPNVDIFEVRHRAHDFFLNICRQLELVLHQSSTHRVLLSASLRREERFKIKWEIWKLEMPVLGMTTILIWSRLLHLLFVPLRFCPYIMLKLENIFLL